ncbi:MAG: metal-dependent transcriptional regulator [Methanoregulaceae archaeon]
MLSRKTEDYLEAILNVTLEKGYAKTKDIAVQLGVRPPSVVEMVQKLHRLKLIMYRKYEGVTLTPEGKAVAEVIKYRHDTLTAFLTLIGIRDDIADRDACIIEHELSKETVEQIRRYVEFLQTPRARLLLVEDFARFCQADMLRNTGPVAGKP